MRTRDGILHELDKILHDPRLNAVEVYVKVLRLWEKESKEETDEEGTTGRA